PDFVGDTVIPVDHGRRRTDGRLALREWYLDDRDARPRARPVGHGGRRIYHPSARHHRDHRHPDSWLGGATTGTEVSQVAISGAGDNRPDARPRTLGAAAQRSARYLDRRTSADRASANGVSGSDL